MRDRAAAALAARRRRRLTRAKKTTFKTGQDLGCVVLANGTATKCCYDEVTPRCPKCPPGAGDTSDLFGCWGGFFGTSGATLPYDWSYAGYGYGESKLPTWLPVVGDVKRDFGAKGDGV